jgi:hypothetical protein
MWPLMFACCSASRLDRSAKEKKWDTGVVLAAWEG